MTSTLQTSAGSTDRVEPNTVRSRLVAQSLNGLDRRAQAPTSPEARSKLLNATTIDVPVRDIDQEVKEAFLAVCHGCSVQLATLLAETRKRGLSDEDVRESLQASEINEAFRAYRSNSGELYLECEFGTTGAVASINELFAELQSDVTLPEKPSETTGYRLSDEVREHGHGLIAAEALILDVCHTLNKHFRKGTVVVPIRQIQRVVVVYHAGETGGVRVKDVVNDLIKRRILEEGRHYIEGSRCVRLAIRGEFEHHQPSKFALLTNCPQKELLLVAADHCTFGFRSRNVVARRAVKQLMHARHGIHKRKFNKHVRELIAAGVLEAREKYGFEQLRLTEIASCRITGRIPGVLPWDVPAEFRPESDADPFARRNWYLEFFKVKERRQAILDDATFSPTVCAIVAIGIEFSRHANPEAWLLRTLCVESGFSHQEVLRALAELDVSGHAHFRVGRGDGEITVEFNNLGNETSQELLSMDDVAEALHKEREAEEAGKTT